MNVTAARWLISSAANPQARVRLFCFPYAGGGAHIYREWMRGLPKEVEVCSVQLPGHGSRLHEPLFVRLRPLVEELARVLLPHLQAKPFAFFGHSMGALISFELSRLLQREHGLRPSHLFVSGRRAPQLADDEPPIFNLPEQEFLEELRELNGTPKEVLEHPELMALVLPLLRADFAICQTYDYTAGPPLGCPITAFGGLQDDEAGREELEPWREQTTAAFSLRMLPGDHFFLHTAQKPLLQTVAQQLVALTTCNA